jgi:1-acyl-sn-glycerol-3-phosphate acyltransferase
MIALWLVLLTGQLLLRLVRPSAQQQWRRIIFRRWGRWITAILGVRVEVVGHPPAQPGILVCNHLSYLDIIVLSGCFDAVFVSKAEVAQWPLVGPMTRSADTIFVQRERKRELPDVNRRIAAALAAGDSVVIFPEGTSTKGESVAPFRGPLLFHAAAGGHPVYYASISYRTGAGDAHPSEAVCWWGDMPFGPHFLRLLGLSRIDARVEFGADPVQESDRKLLAEKLWQAIHQIFIPVA